MIEEFPSPWQGLFARTAEPGRRLAFRELRRQGEVFLVLPEERRAARATLALYAAQSPRARLLKRALTLWLRFGPVTPGRRQEIRLADADPFVRFLREAGAACCETASPFGIYVGNGTPEGRRFILAAFDRSNRVQAIVKAGTGPGARALVEREFAFLAAAPAGTPGVPQVRARFDSGIVTAFAMEHVAGTSPRGIEPARLRAVLSPWVRREATVAVGEFVQAQRLAQCVPWPANLASVHTKLAGRGVHAALSHGDFAPWNVKVCPRAGAWTMVDWERGERVGLPCWDWFHFVVQTEFLVRKARPATVAEGLEAMFDEEHFRGYSELAGTAGLERELFLAYLLYVIHLIRPGEGLEEARELLSLLELQWLRR
jgi:hypothetical protein